MLFGVVLAESELTRESELRHQGISASQKPSRATAVQVNGSNISSELGTTLERDTTPTTPKRPHFTTTHTSNTSMSSTPLQSLWDASASQPFTPAISKEQQFTVGFTLLFAALVLTGLFGMSM